MRLRWMGDSNRKNVFVVGAGASTEFGLPVGSVLKDNIATLCDFEEDAIGGFEGGSALLRKALCRISQGEPEKYPLRSLFQAGKHISMVMPAAPSIDNYLNTHQHRHEVTLVGKLAIAEAISKAERDSNLFVSADNIYNRLDFERTKNTWLLGLSRLLLTVASFSEFLVAISKITFVTFNYDRCIEQFFISLAVTYFPDQNDAASRVLEVLDVVHVYGSLGKLESTYPDTRYGNSFNEVSLYTAADTLRIFPEGVMDDGVFRSIEAALAECEVLVFSGFAFHPMNIDLFPSYDFPQLQKLIVTSRGFSKNDIAVLTEKLDDKFLLKPEFDAVEAKDIFSAYAQFFLNQT